MSEVIDTLDSTLDDAQDEDGDVVVLSLVRANGTARIQPSSPMTPDVVRILKDELPDPVARALADLGDAVPDGYWTPCREDPAAYDPPHCPNQHGPGFRAVVQRVMRATDACLDCYVFVHCMKVASANAEASRPPLSGVLAGELHGTSLSDVLVRSAMEELPWTA